MCGRFAVTHPSDEMAQLFGAAPANDLPDVPDYNVCPTTQVHVVTSDAGHRHLGAMRWGFLPKWYQTETAGPLLINARAETLAEKPTFRDACRTRRCLIPVSGFYEWTKDTDGTRLPWYMSPAQSGPLVFAGIWQRWDMGEGPRNTCAIVTCAANDTIAPIHHRMPVILGPEDWPLWLGEVGHGAATLMRAAPEDALRIWRVSREVNSNRAIGAGLTRRLTGEGHT